MQQGTAVQAPGTYCATFTISCVRQDPSSPFINLIEPCINLVIEAGTNDEYMHIRVQARGRAKM